ncbi:MAG: N-acetylmuramic acid 6-phosphate etherase [Phycisphaerales bacterium]|nr:N-acetylmuramic acid 6-phosphate etherase [Phycisphaerales bacterium]
MSLPFDRGHIETEMQNVCTMNLDTLETKELVSLLAKDHRQAISAVEDATDVIARFIEDLAQRIRLGGRLIYIGCGTSGRLGVLDAAECPPTFQTDPSVIVGLIAGGDNSLRTSSEGKEDEPYGAKEELEKLKISDRDTILGIAAGGTTPWVLGGLEFAKKIGASTAFLTCSSEEPECDHLISLHTGAEPLTGSTRMKAATATKLTLNIITTTLFTLLGKVYGNLMVDLKASNAKLHDRAIRIVSQICGLDRKTAASLLELSKGDVKNAVVMHWHSIDFETAEQKLSDAGGNLRGAL